MVDVEQRALGPFEQKAAASFQGMMQPGRRITHERSEPIGVSQVLFRDGVGVKRFKVRKQSAQQSVLVIDDSGHSVPKRSGVVEIGDAYTVDPADFITVTRTDSPSRRPQMVGDGGGFLGQPFLGEMVRKDDMGSIADVEPFADVDTLRGERVPISLSRR